VQVTLYIDDDLTEPTPYRAALMPDVKSKSQEPS
jgi:hypothetical protein